MAGPGETCDERADAARPGQTRSPLCTLSREHRPASRASTAHRGRTRGARASDRQDKTPQNRWVCSSRLQIQTEEFRHTGGSEALQMCIPDRVAVGDVSRLWVWLGCLHSGSTEPACGDGHPAFPESCRRRGMRPRRSAASRTRQTPDTAGERRALSASPSTVRPPTVHRPSTVRPPPGWVRPSGRRLAAGCRLCSSRRRRLCLVSHARRRRPAPDCLQRAAAVDIESPAAHGFTRLMVQK